MSPLLDGLVRRRYLVLGALAVLMYLGGESRLVGRTDWPFFSWGSDLLFGQHGTLTRGPNRFPATLPGGLHLYANYPFIQIGPPALLLAKGLQVGANQGLLLSGAVIQGLGLVAVFCTDRAFRGFQRFHDLHVLVAGALVTVGWGGLTHFRHLDDAMTLAAIAGVCWAMRSGHLPVAGILLGIAAAAKPWGVVALAMVLAAPSWRTRAATLGVAALTALVFWGPFVFADSSTLHLGTVGLSTSPGSVVATVTALRIANAEDLRLIQFGVGLGLALLVAARGFWPLSPLVAFVARLLIEPAAYTYYGSAVIAAALIADLGLRRMPVPLLTATAAMGWLVAEASSEHVASRVRAVEYGGLLLAALILSIKGLGTGSTGPRGLAAVEDQVR